MAHLREFNPYHDKTGRFTSKGRAVMLVTSDVHAAAEALQAGKPVRLRHVREVSTLLDKLASEADNAMKAGKDAPNIDLCKVSVKGTNLFCAQSKGIARIDMPQLGGKPVPGSKADKLPKDGRGEVDVSKPFIDHLTTMGVKVSQGTELASHLRASQNELVGTKVGGMMRAALKGRFDPAGKAIFVTRDNYVIDGHHRWASAVGVDARDGSLGGMRMNVLRVDLDIIDALRETTRFTSEYGIAPKAGRVREVAVSDPRIDAIVSWVAKIKG